MIEFDLMVYSKFQPLIKQFSADFSFPKKLYMSLIYNRINYITRF